MPEEDAPVAWVPEGAWVAGQRAGTTMHWPLVTALGVCCAGVAVGVCCASEALDPAFAGAFAFALHVVRVVAAPLKVLS